METNNQNILKPVMTYGAVIGFLFVIISIAFLVANYLPIGIAPSIVMFVVSVAIYYTGIHLATKKIRDTVWGGYMTFGQGLLIGTLVVFFASIISSAYTYFQNTVIDPDYFTRAINAQKDWMTNFMQSSGVSEDQIEESLVKLDEKLENPNHLLTFFTSILGGAIFGLILSLISSAILKRNKGIFDEPEVIDQEIN